MSSSFDATHALRFDLSRGSVRATSRDERLLLVPADALMSLVQSAPPDEAEAFCRALGRTIGERVAHRMSNASTATVDAFVAQWAGEAALAGIGALSVERWGRALVVVVERSALSAPRMAAVIAAALEAATGRQVWAIVLAKDEDVSRILVAGESAVVKTGELIAAGTPWAEALQRLHGGRS